MITIKAFNRISTVETKAKLKFCNLVFKMIFQEKSVASAKLFVALGLSILIYMADGINHSQLAPFFPNEAERNKGKSRCEFSEGFDPVTIKKVPILYYFSTSIFNDQPWNVPTSNPGPKKLIFWGIPRRKQEVRFF